jgi:hypothetical protein
MHLSIRTSGSHTRAVARHAGPEFPTISHISPAIDTIESTGGVSRRAREEAAVLHGKNVRLETSEAAARLADDGGEDHDERDHDEREVRVGR